MVIDNIGTAKWRNAVLGGSITLASANPFDSPNIDPAFLNSDFDIFTIREGVKAAHRFAAAPAWKDYVIGPYGALAEANTDAEIEAFARSNAVTEYHPCSTASMSPKGSPHGVVNPDFTVKNTVGLRIVDASVLVRWFFSFMIGPLLDASFGGGGVLSQSSRPPTLRQFSTPLRSEQRR
jgi:hypothetical protein